jgi:outer membrane protein OmpA-like peptidoglycan-associated protein
MKQQIRKFGLIMGFVIPIMLTGCALQKLWDHDYAVFDKAQKHVSQAREDFEAVKNLQAVQDKYPDEFQKAEGDLQSAEQELQTLEAHLHSTEARKRESLDQLSSSITEKARESRAASQLILKRYYLDTVTPMLNKAEKELDDLIKDDLNHPLNKFKPLLEDMSQKVEQVKRDQDVLTLAEVMKDIDTLVQMKATMASDIQRTIQANDVSFEIGQYQLSDAAVRDLDNLVEQVIAAKTAFQKRYDGESVEIQIKTVGYTDETDFQMGAGFMAPFPKSFKQQIPDDPMRRRFFLNQLLSEFRARTVSDYLKQRILQTDNNLTLQEEILGKGEEIPPDVSAPFPETDPRRRICRVYCYVTTPGH